MCSNASANSRSTDPSGGRCRLVGHSGHPGVVQSATVWLPASCAAWAGRVVWADPTAVGSIRRHPARRDPIRRDPSRPGPPRSRRGAALRREWGRGGAAAAPTLPPSRRHPRVEFPIDRERAGVGRSLVTLADRVVRPRARSRPDCGRSSQEPVTQTGVPSHARSPPRPCAAVDPHGGRWLDASRTVERDPPESARQNPPSRGVVFDRQYTNCMSLYGCRSRQRTLETGAPPRHESESESPRDERTTPRAEV